MPEEEKTAVEETKAAEEETEVEEAEVEEKAETEEAKTVEEKAVEEAKVEAKTDEKAKEGDAPEETKTTGGGGSIDPSEITEMLEAKLPKAVPLGCILTINLNLGANISEIGCIGVFDGCVIGFIHTPEGYAYQTEGGGTLGILYEDYKASLASSLNSLSLDVLNISDCGSSLPSKESIRFTVNITGANEGK